MSFTREKADDLAAKRKHLTGDAIAERCVKP
jgi:hypothetical protein